MLVLTGGGKPGGDRPTGGAPFEPAPETPARADLARPNTYPVARVRGLRLLYERPGGKAKVRISGRTEWGTPRILSVVERRGDWLGVLAPELKNGDVGWIRRARVDRLSAVGYSLHADVSKREIVVRREGRLLRRLKVGVGRPGHSTPRGRFAVTDKLRVADPGSPYGCCVLALTGHQTKLPPGWPGGDRLAVHATGDLTNLGQAVSLGCMRSDPDDARWLIENVPVGAPMFIRA
ncbi:MAG: L,D-transpeptidase [Thermoleophilaceae bacterium]